jgi:DNA-binding NtrC family response regulator
MATILVVDDDAGLLEVIGRGLHHQGYDVICAATAREALATVAGTTEIDLLLVDVALPDLDGVGLAREARAMRPWLPVRFMSGYVRSLQLVGAVHGRVIDKPVRIEALDREIRRTLAEGRAAPA